MSEEGQALLLRLAALQAKYDAMVAHPLAGAALPPPRRRSRRPRLHGTPQGLAELRESIARLRASGDLLWGDGAGPPAPK